MDFETLEAKLSLLPISVRAQFFMTPRDVWHSRVDQRRWIYDQANVCAGGATLEIGTGFGLSTVIIAAAREGQPFSTIDILPERINYTSILCAYVGVPLPKFFLGDSIAILETLKPDYRFVFIDGYHKYRYEKAHLEFALHCPDATVVMDDVIDVHQDAFWFNTENIIGRQIGRSQSLYHAVGKFLNDGGGPKLYREVGCPSSYFGRWTVFHT